MLDSISLSFSDEFLASAAYSGVTANKLKSVNAVMIDPNNFL